MDDLRELSRRLTMAIFKIDGTEYINGQKSGIKESELCLMCALDDGKSHSQREISDEWQIPKTTLNTIVKQWERDNLLTMSAIPGKRREMQICFTESGKKLVEKSLAFAYRAEDSAMARTLEKYSDTFIEAAEYFAGALQEEFEKTTY